MLKPFHTKHQTPLGKHAQLIALADALSRAVIHNIGRQLIFFGGGWTVILVLFYWLGEKGLLWLGPLGYIGIIALIFKMMKDEMRRQLGDYANGYGVAHDPVTGKQIYLLIACPECRKENYSSRYLR